MQAKTIFTVVIGAVCSVLYAQDASQTYLEAFTRGDFKPKQPAAVYHMNDGEHYAALNADGTKIMSYDYASGRDSVCLFDVATTKNCAIKQIEGFTFADNEQKMLIHTGATKIYRR